MTGCQVGERNKGELNSGIRLNRYGIEKLKTEFMDIEEPRIKMNYIFGSNWFYFRFSFIPTSFVLTFSC